LAEKRPIYRRFSSRLDSEAARVVIKPQTDRREPGLRDSLLAGNNAESEGPDRRVFDVLLYERDRRPRTPRRYL